MKAKDSLSREEFEERISRLAGRLERREPPEDLWDKIEARLAEETGRAASPAGQAGGRRFVMNRFLRAFRLADGRWSGRRVSLAAAAIVLVTAVSVPVLRKSVVSLASGADLRGLAGADKDAARAEREYRKAIERLALAAGRNEKNIDPGLLALYREKIELLDGSIRECRMALESNYRNPMAHAALLYCYKQKAETLRQMAGAKAS
jgi:hypothetical protein